MTTTMTMMTIDGAKTYGLTAAITVSHQTASRFRPCAVALVIKLQGELNKSRVVASRGDASKVTGVNDLSSARIKAATR